MWETVSIEIKGQRIAAKAPLILSASRATDIPAFYMREFMERHRAGVLQWINPFNGASQWIFLQKARFIVFWSKNPEPLLKHVDEIKGRGIDFYVQFTLNDYEEEGYEPGLPSLDERIETFKRLSRILGKERVLWRFDPLLLTREVGVSRLVSKIERIGDAIARHTEKLIFSYVDIATYRKVRTRMERNRIEVVDWDPIQMEKVAERIAFLCRGWGIEAATCGEGMDLSSYSIRHNSCIDGDLISRLCPKDEVLKKFIRDGKAGRFKDRGQRPECRCIPSKDIGRYDTCAYGCVYCYANRTIKKSTKVKITS